MRDPIDWQTSRCKNLPCKSYHVSEACSTGELDVSVDMPQTPARLASFFAWAKCIVPAERLYAFNLFETAHQIGEKASNCKFFAGLEDFLKRWGLLRTGHA